MAFLAIHYASFRTILSLFPRENPGREGKKDCHSLATSAEEMLAISNQLFILHSHGVNGSVLECGCFKGYSSCCLSLACRRLGYPFVIADSFAGLPPDDDDVGTNRYYQVGDFAGSRQEVEQNLRTFGDIASVEFLEGWYSDTLRGWDRPLALLWMDVDLVSSTKDLLEPCLPHLDPRGLIFSHEFLADLVRDGKIVAQRTDQPAPSLRSSRRRTPFTGPHSSGIAWGLSGDAHLSASNPTSCWTSSSLGYPASASPPPPRRRSRSSRQSTKAFTIRATVRRSGGGPGIPAGQTAPSRWPSGTGTVRWRL